MWEQIRNHETLFVMFRKAFWAIGGQLSKVLGDLRFELNYNRQDSPRPIVQFETMEQILTIFRAERYVVDLVNFAVKAKMNAAYLRLDTLEDPILIQKQTSELEELRERENRRQARLAEIKAENPKLFAELQKLDAESVDDAKATASVAAQATK